MKKQIIEVIKNMKALTPTHIEDAAGEILSLMDDQLSYLKDEVEDYKDRLSNATAEMREMEKEIRDAYRSHS